MIFFQIVAFLVGVAIVVLTLASSVRTFVLPRSAQDPITRFVFTRIRWFFDFRNRWSTTFEEQDRVLALFAPIALLALVPTWYIMITIGFTFMFWGTGIESWSEAYKISGSSLLTLGFNKSEELQHTVLEFAAATIGLMLVALLIAYIPTMYGAFSRREVEVNKLMVRAGSPPSAIEMILRFHRLDRLNKLPDFWERWENWFVEIEESHTSLAALVFFRSPQPDQSWITSAGTVLDAAALILSAVNLPNQVREERTFRGNQLPSDAAAALCLRAGFIALRRIADFFRVAYNHDPRFPEDPISITREEFDEACKALAEGGVPLTADREKAWQDFAGWRVNYDFVLLTLARLTNAPYAPWSSDRGPIYMSGNRRTLPNLE